MKKQIATFIVLALTVYSCSKVPITGRKQLNMLPEAMMMDMSLSNYSQFKSEHQIINGTSDATMVKTVGQRMSGAVETYLRKHNEYKRIKNYKWEFNLAQTSEANAWCMPGGKVMVYSGILPITQNEAGLAVVLGHEIAHAVARHGNERMSQELLVAMGGIGLSVAISQKPKETQDIFLTAYGVGSTLGIMLPYSRMQEEEADKMGVVFMAIAGYDPKQALDFWKRMEAQNNPKIPQWLSTHPSDATRIKKLEDFMPVAEVYYNEYKNNH